MNTGVIQKIKGAPGDSGVYIFRQSKDVLYIGKASNLKNRLKSYLKATDLKTQSLHKEADNLEYTVLRSDIEALIEESRLIKSLKPKYNVLWMDDKSYFYVYFTNDIFPKIYIGHERPRRIMNNESGIKQKTLNSSFVIRHSRIGPFTDGGSLRVVMKILRRQFPYCTCLRQGYGKASLSGHSHLRDCLNAQIGKCLGICCKKNNANDEKGIANYANSSHDSHTASQLSRYSKNIRAIKTILSGKKTLKNAADEKERWALEKIFEHRDFIETDYTSNNSNMPNLQRIECYDNSNFAGKEAVGAMTTLTRNSGQLTKPTSKVGSPTGSVGANDEWVADKNQWRKFKIKSAPTRDDPKMIGEILSRRLNHPEWPYPDLIIIDGGITQYRAAKRVLDAFHLKHSKPTSKVGSPTGSVGASNIKLLSYAKPQRKVIGMAKAPKELQELIERAIYQTHWFVINYHRQVRARKFIPK